MIVWGADGSSTAQIGRKVQTKEDAWTPGQTPTFGPAHVLTGQLEALAQPDLVALDHRQQHFYVASNTGFSIDAELTGDQDLTAGDLRNTEFDLSVSLGENGSDAFGRHAQYPPSSWRSRRYEHGYSYAGRSHHTQTRVYGQPTHRSK